MVRPPLKKFKDDPRRRLTILEPSRVLQPQPLYLPCFVKSMNRSTKITPKSLSLLEQLFIVKTPATNDDDDNLVSIQFLFGEALPNWLSVGLQNVSIDIIPSAIGGSGEPRA